MAPGIRDVPAFEQHVVNPVPGEKMAGGQAGLTGADDHGGGAAGPALERACRHTRTSTSTWVGLVTISYTAERFWDCATTASMSSGEASASISNVTLMRW